MHTLLVICQVIVSIVLVVSIMLQPSKTDGINGLISGSSDTFFSKNRTQTREGFLIKLTVVSAVLFIILTVSLNLVK